MLFSHCHLRLKKKKPLCKLSRNCCWVNELLLALEITRKVTECSFCPKKVALDMECHMQLFLPHHRTCYKDSPTWVEIMPPIPASKHIL